MTIKRLEGFATGTGYLKMTRSIGKNILKNTGFCVCDTNKAYMQKNNIYAHYNKIMGIWIIENGIDAGSWLII